MIRGEREPGQSWTELDWLLLVALQEYEDDLCGGCGTPRTYGMHPDAKGRYEAHAITCHACAAQGSARPSDRPGRYRFAQPDQLMQYAMDHPSHVSPPFT